MHAKQYNTMCGHISQDKMRQHRVIKKQDYIRQSKTIPDQINQYTRQSNAI